LIRWPVSHVTSQSVGQSISWPANLQDAFLLGEVDIRLKIKIAIWAERL